MKVALIDNGSLEPAAHANLRALAAELTRCTGLPVHAVSWKHSDRIRPLALAAGEADVVRAGNCPRPGGRAWTLVPWVTEQFARGEREFVFVPFFISPQGAIGSALRHDLETLQQKLGPFAVTFSGGLTAENALIAILAERIREVIHARQLAAPPVIVVDHGGPSPASAILRNEIAAAVRQRLGNEVGPLAAASLQGSDHAHNHPLFAEQLATAGFDGGDIVVAPLFLAPGRHAGPAGDLARIATVAAERARAASLRCHFADLIGTHPLVALTLAAELRDLRLSVPPGSASTPGSLSSRPLQHSVAALRPALIPSPFTA
jgi:sirohydrochlorin ferrochelatase